MPPTFQDFTALGELGQCSLRRTSISRSIYPDVHDCRHAFFMYVPCFPWFTWKTMVHRTCRVTYAGQSASQLFCPKFAAVSTLRLKGRLRHPRSTQVQSTRSSGLYSIPSDKLCTRSSGLYIISENETHYPSGRETYSSTTVDRIAVLPLLS